MMEQLFKERKEKLYLFKSLRKKRQQKRKEVPEGLYSKCPDCKELILTSHLKKNLSVCPNCGSHLKLSDNDDVYVPRYVYHCGNESRERIDF